MLGGADTRAQPEKPCFFGLRPQEQAFPTSPRRAVCPSEEAALPNRRRTRCEACQLVVRDIYSVARCRPKPAAAHGFFARRRTKSNADLEAWAAAAARRPLRGGAWSIAGGGCGMSLRRAPIPEPPSPSAHRALHAAPPPDQRGRSAPWQTICSEIPLRHPPRPGKSDTGDLLLARIPALRFPRPHPSAAAKPWRLGLDRRGAADVRRAAG